MTTGYIVSGRGDLDALFKPRVSTAIANTNFKSNGGVDLAQRFEPRAGSTPIANTNFVAGASDLASLFMSIGAITLSNKSITSDVLSPTNPVVAYGLEPDGDIIQEIQLANTDIGDWISPKASASSAYEVRATLSSGVAPTAGTLNTWMAISSYRSWGLTRTTNGTSTSVILVEIRLGVYDARVLHRHADVRPGAVKVF